MRQALHAVHPLLPLLLVPPPRVLRLLVRFVLLLLRRRRLLRRQRVRFVLVESAMMSLLQRVFSLPVFLRPLRALGMLPALVVLLL
jgi:hypothetical protein